MLQCQVEIGQAMDNQNHFQLTLRLRLDSQPNEQATYTGEIDAVGLFRVDENWPDNKATLVQTHGASVLFAAIRELVLNITSRGPWPPVQLNTFSFVPPKNQPTTEPSKTLVRS